MTEFQRKAQHSESRSAFQKLYGRLLYLAFETVLWILWFRKRGLIHGKLPDVTFVLVSNHSSYLDWMLLDVVLRRKFCREIIFLAKRKVVQNPVFGALARECRAVVVDETAKSKAIALAVRVFENSDPESKQIVAIFLKALEAALVNKFRVPVVLRWWQENAACSLFQWHCAAFGRHGRRNEACLDSEDRYLLSIS